MANLLERRSIRKYDINTKISRKELENILSDALRAPSSMNMQPTRFAVIESKEAKEKLRPFLYGNSLQLDTSSAMILLLTDLQKYEHAADIYNQAVQKGLMPEDVRERQLQNIGKLAQSADVQQTEKTGLIDGGLIAMQLMHIARNYGYDTCAIGGFKKDGVAETFGYNPKRYAPFLIVSIGKKDEDGYPSARLDVNQVATFL